MLILKSVDEAAALFFTDLLCLIVLLACLGYLCVKLLC